MGEVVEAAKALLGANPSLPYLVYHLEAFANNKAVDGALKQVKALAPDTPTIFFSSDPDSGKILCMSQCSKQSVGAGLKANEWCGSVSALINGKGGGKPESAQASGTNTARLNQAMEIAEKFAMEKLKVGKVTVAPFNVTAPAPAAPVAAKASKAGKGEKRKGSSSNGSVVSGPKNTCLPVLVTAAYTSQEIQHKLGDTFSMTSGPVSLTEPVSSCLYLASSAGQTQLAGKTPADQASVLQWLLYSAGDLRHSVGGWVLPTMEQCEGANQGTVNRSKADLGARLDVLDKCLVTKTFLVGERISLADIGMAMTLLPAFTEVLDQAFRSSHRHLTRWFNTIIHQELVVKVIGTVKLCVKEAEMKQGAKKDKKEKAPKPEKKKEEPKKKKDDTKKPSEEPMEMPAEPKKTDPLDPLPKGTFDLEDWKRFYSNNDEDKSCEYFWSKFDPSCYSIWRGDYRYNKELTQIFMSCNLMGGMFQRLEKLKKNAFASAMLFGENNNSSISGIWVFKGHQLAFDLNEDWQVDYSSYEWKKLDPSVTETKALVNQYLKWEGQDLEGRPFNQGKIFK